MYGPGPISEERQYSSKQSHWRSAAVAVCVLTSFVVGGTFFDSKKQVQQAIPTSTVGSGNQNVDQVTCLKNGLAPLSMTLQSVQTLSNKLHVEVKSTDGGAKVDSFYEPSSGPASPSHIVTVKYGPGRVERQTVDEPNYTNPQRAVFQAITMCSVKNHD